MKNIFYVFNRVLPVSRILIFLVPCCMGVSTVFAGNVITNGTKLKVLPGTTSVSVNDLVIKNGATLNNSGLLILKKGLNNENPAPNSIGTGPVKLMGDVIQTLNGQNTFQDLIINNASGVSIGGNTSVNGALTLNSGMVTLGNYNLLLGPLSSISGTPSSTSMIVATDAGELRKNFVTGFNGSYTFPIGDNTGTPDYSPVMLNFTTGSFGTDNYVGINLRNFKYPDPLISGNYLNRYWNISQSGITGLSCNAVYQYVPADVVGNENLILCTKISPVPVITYGPANIVTDQLAANAIESFGTYTGCALAGGSPPSLTGPIQVCANSSGNVYITDAGKTNYQWVVSSGGTITAGGTASSNTATVTWNSSGPQTVSVNYDGSSGPTVLNVTVNPSFPVSVSIAASANPVCAGTNVTFTATPVNGGTTPSYQWYKGVNPVGGNSPVYSYVPVNGDAISVKLTSNLTCTSNNPATSNTVTMTVNPVLPVSVSIAASANPVCAGTNVTFTATPVNGGTTPSYQWYKGVNPVGGNSPVYSYIPVNGDAISVKLTSNLTCTSNNPATSNTVTMTVNPVLPVSVSIVASANPVCAGTNVTFTATPVNGGTIPSYQWYKGVNPVGGNSPVYSYIPVNGDAISVKLTSNLTCTSNNPATSNTVTMTVNPVLPVSVTIAASANPVCAGTNVTFTATPVNGGTTPSYQWYKGVNPVGGNSPVYSYIPADGDAISVKLTSSETCASNSPATSNTVTMTVNPVLPVSVTIAASANPVCAGTNVTFTATPVNGGTTPSYQWYKGVNPVGGNSPIYSYIPADADAISVKLTSSETCTSNSPATSNTETMTVNPVLPVSVTIAASANPVCVGANVTFTATPVNGGTTPSYQWYKGVNPVGGNSPVYSYIPVNGDAISVKLTSSETCTSSNPATSSAVTMTVNPLPVPVITGPASTCRSTTTVIYSTEAGMTGYTWNVSSGGTITGGAGSNAITVMWNLTGAQTVSVSYTNSNGCTAANPSVLNVNVSGATLSGPTEACKLSTQIYTTQPGMGNTYVWVISPGGIKIAGGGASNNTCTIKWIATGSRYVKVTYTNANCTSTAILEVNVSTSSPSISGPSTLCINSVGTFSTDAGMTDYIWTISPGGTINQPSNNNVITANWMVAGAQWIRVIYTSQSCAMTPTTFYLNVLDIPVPNLSGPEGPICPGSAGNLYTTDPGKKDYVWTVSPGNVITRGGGITDNTITITWYEAGPQYVSVNYNESYLCLAPNPTFLDVNVLTSPVPIITGPAEVNVNTICQYETQSEMTNYEWSVSSGGTIISGGGKQNSWIKILWSVVGQQTVGVNFEDNDGCSALESSIFPVMVNPPPRSPDHVSNNGFDVINNLNETLNNDQLPVFTVFPVPNNGKFTLSITSEKTDTYAITIINSLGVEVYNMKNLTVTGFHKQMVDISSVTEGIYMIIVRNAEGQTSRRILINK